MYKVFLNERVIIIGAPSKIDHEGKAVFFGESSTEDDVKKWFNVFLKNDLKTVTLQHNQPKEFFKLFQTAFKLLPAAGGVVKSADKFLFIFRNEKWDLPKGKIEKGETAEFAALREVEEECGISGHSVVKQLPSTYHIYKSLYKKWKGSWILKETFWFEMQYSGENQGTPETREGISEIRWFPKSEMNEVLTNTYENLKPLIQLYRA